MTFYISGGLDKPKEHCSECTLKIIDGMSENHAEDDHGEKYICESACEGEKDSYFYSLDGDVESFFADKLGSGTIKITVPEYARYDDSNIDVESLSIEDVTVDERRRLTGIRAMRKGNKKILVVLVRDNYGNVPQQSQQEMEYAIFGGDGNGVNMVSVHFILRQVSDIIILSLTINHLVIIRTEREIHVMFRWCTYFR